MLLLVMIVLSGCTQQPAPQIPEQEAIALADQTDEGKLIAAMNQSFAGIQGCTVDGVISGMNEWSIASGLGRMPEATDATRAYLAGILESAKKCSPNIEKSVSKTSEGKYLVSYTWITPSDCSEQTIFNRVEGGYIEIEVDMQTNTTNIVKGKLSAEQLKAVQTVLETTGNCSSAVIMGMASAVMPLTQ